MSFKKLTIGILIVLIAACDVSSSNSVKKVNDENKSLNDMSNIENRLSYFEAKKLSIGFLGADITEDIKNNLLTLEHKSKNSNEVNAQFVLALISFYDGNSIQKNEAIKKFYRLAEIGHPYAALELYKYAKSDINNFNNVKIVTNLSTEILNIKINEFIRLAISNNINAAYYYYSEYLTKNHDEIDSFNFSSSIVEHVFLNTSSYLGNIPDLDIFLIYANLLLNSNLDQENKIKAKALVYYFSENGHLYAEEMDNPNYLELNRIIKKIRNKHPIEKNDFDLMNVYIGKISNANRLFISDWIEKEIDYR